MLSQLTAEHVQGHLKVILAFNTGLASNLVHAIAIEGRIRSRSSQGYLGITYWIGFKLNTCYHNWRPNMFKVIPRSFEHLLLDRPQTWNMWSQLTAKHVQCHLKVIWTFLTGFASNLVHVITIDGQTCSRSYQGQWSIYYWICLKLSTREYNWQPNMFKVISRSSWYIVLDWPQTWYMQPVLSLCLHN